MLLGSGSPAQSTVPGQPCHRPHAPDGCPCLPSFTRVGRPSCPPGERSSGTSCTSPPPTCHLHALPLLPDPREDNVQLWAQRYPVASLPQRGMQEPGGVEDGDHQAWGSFWARRVDGSGPSPEAGGLPRRSLGASDALQHPGVPLPFPWGSRPAGAGGIFFPTWFLQWGSGGDLPSWFLLPGCPAQPCAKVARQRGGLTLGFRGAQEAKTQPGAGTGWPREGICWPNQPVCPWAGWRHACCPSGSKEEQRIPLSPSAPAIFATHVAGINLGLSSVMWSGGSSSQTPAVLCDGPRFQACPRGSLGHGLFARGLVPGAQAWDASGTAHGSLETSRLPWQPPGNFLLLLRAPSRRGPLWDCPHAFLASSA